MEGMGPGHWVGDLTFCWDRGPIDPAPVEVLGAGLEFSKRHHMILKLPFHDKPLSRPESQIKYTRETLINSREHN